MNRRNLLALLALLAFLTGCDSGPGPGSSRNSADNYPSRTITVICPWAAGGGTDRLARFAADYLQKELGKPVVVVNRTGGSGAVGHSAGALAKPDGYTITMGTFELSTMHWMGISDLTWESFQPLAQLNADAAAIIVRQDAPWKSLPEFLDYVRQNPGKLKMSGTATGGAWDLARAGFLLAAQLPVDSILWIPNKGSAPSIVELLGQHIDAVCCSVPEAATQIEAGQLRVLSVMAPERIGQYPALTTARESGVPWDAVGWRGLLLPKGTPPPIVERLSQVCEGMIASPEFKEFMQKNGFATQFRNPEAFAQFLQQQDAQWKTVIEKTGYARQ